MRSRLRAVFASRFALLVAALVLLGSGAVFAGTRLDDDRTSGDAAPARVRPDGSLTQQPQPLTLEDVAKHRRGSPAATVIGLWYWAQWGSTPNVIDLYHPAVVRIVGAAEIAGAYANRRGPVVSARPRIVDEAAGPHGMRSITIEALRKNTAPESYSFTLDKVRGRWVVVFDTLLESGIAAYIQLRRTPESQKDDPPTAAQRAGIEAARKYRVAYLCRDQPPPPAPPPPIAGSLAC